MRNVLRDEARAVLETLSRQERKDLQRMTTTTRKRRPSTTLNTSLDQSALSEASAALREANLAFAEAHPGESPGRQPVHTVYGGAQLFDVRFGSQARRHRSSARWSSTRPTPATSAKRSASRIIPRSATINQRVRDKLTREPIEDFRIDFEDGYGNRPDAEEDGHAGVVAREVAKGMQHGTLSPFIGMRIKPLNEELRVRSIRTLDLVLTELVEAADAAAERWIVTMPKVTIIEQVEYTVAVLASARAQARSGRRYAAVRGDGRDAADRSSTRTARSLLPRYSRCVGRPTPRRALRHVRLHGGHQHHRGASAHAASRVRFREALHAGRVRGHRTSGCPTDRRR